MPAAPATGPAAADEIVMLSEDDVPEEQNEKRQHYAVHKSGEAKAFRSGSAGLGIPDVRRR